MGEPKECPNPFCANAFEYPGGPDRCPSCQFPVQEWLATRTESEAGDSMTREPAE